MFQEVGRTIEMVSLPMREVIVTEDGALPRFEEKTQKRKDRPDVALSDLVFHVAASFRGHPHINNVLTHISGANWAAVEEALRAILDPHTGSNGLSPLAWNIVDLMCADRGVTGRILKPFYRDLLTAILGDEVASRFIAHVTSLFLESEIAAQSVLVRNPAGGSGPANDGAGS